MEASTSLMTRRSLTLHDQLSVVHSNNLRDLLKLPDSSSDQPNPNPNPNPSPNTTWRTLRDLLQQHTHPDQSEAQPRPVRVPLMALLEQPAQRHVASQEEVVIEVTSEQEAHVAGRGEGREELERVSLMALLEQQGEKEEGHVAEGEKVEGHVAEGEGLSCVCCVCMVRKKGAAFIPCGHTFCRPCSRELHVTRGACPLCNGSIAEVLDIF